MRAAIYARISDDREQTQQGVERQITDCEQLADRRGWNIVDRYIDNDVSAYSGKVRPEYRRMLADITDRRLDAVVVYHHDRLHRQPRELEEFFDVCDRAGLRTMASVSGDVDLATDDGRFHARIMGAVARKSSDDQSRRIRRKQLEVAMKGLPTGGGDRPFGFEADRVTLQPDEAAVIRDVVDRLLAGESLRGITTSLNAAGVRTVRGVPWTPQVVKGIVTSARIGGQRQHRGEIVGDAAWPAIVPPEKTERLRRMFADPARKATRAPQRYLLKGLLRCYACDAVLVARPREDGKRRYVDATGPGTTGCGKTYVLGDPVEEYVTEAVLSALESPEIRAALRGDGGNVVDMWQERSDKLTARLDELATAYAEEQITMREWLAAREPLQAQLEDARRKINRSTAATTIEQWSESDIRARWEAATFDQRHALLKAALFHVIVKPAVRGRNKFDPTRFELVWRH